MENQDNSFKNQNTPTENRAASTDSSARPQQNQQFRNQRQNYAKRGRFYFKRKINKVCKVCTRDFSGELDYKNVYFLKRFITEKGKILPRRISGLCAKHHRIVSRTIKQARTIALLSFTARN